MEEHYAWFEPHAEKAVAGATQFDPRSVTFSRAQLGNLAGLVGAASLVYRAGESVAGPD